MALFSTFLRKANNYLLMFVILAKTWKMLFLHYKASSHLKKKQKQIIRSFRKFQAIYFNEKNKYGSMLLQFFSSIIWILFTNVT